MYTAAKNIYREGRVTEDHTSIPIPNLIESQKNSLRALLQMRVLPRREDAACSRLQERLPDTDLRENARWSSSNTPSGMECKCGRMVGLDKLGPPCTFCAATIIMIPAATARSIARVRPPQQHKPSHLRPCDEPVGLKLKYDVDECQSGDDVRGAAEGHHPPRGVGQGPRRGPRPSATSRSRRSTSATSADDGERDLIINGTRARHRQPAPRSPGVFFPTEKGLFAARSSPTAGVDRVRVRLQEPPARPHRPQAEVRGHGVPAPLGIRPTPRS